MVERRIDRRTPFAAAFSFETMSSAAETIANIVRRASGVDVSRSGLGLITRRRLVDGEVLKLEMPLPSAKASLPVFAVVVWSRFHDGRTRAGVRFIQ